MMGYENLLDKPDLTLPFVSQFTIGQPAWFYAGSPLRITKGVVKTMTPNGFRENGDRFFDSIGIWYGNRYSIESSDRVFASLEDNGKDRNTL